MKRNNLRKFIISFGALLVVYGLLVTLLMELESADPTAQIRSVEDALWYVLATLTTVGYGDMVPVTYWGRLLGFIFLLSAFGVYGFIIGQITNFMSTLKEQKELGLNGTAYEKHVVMIGWNEFGQSVISDLIGAGRNIAVVTKDRANIDIIREFYGDDVYTLYSDYNNFDLLRKANLEKASVVFINLNDDTEKLVYVINLKKHFKDLNYVVTLDNGNLKSTFHAAGVTYAISKNEISSKLLASYIYEPDVALFSEEIIAFAHSNEEYDMKQFKVASDNPLRGMPYEKVFYDVKKQCNVVLIGIVKVRNGRHELMKNPEGDIKIEEGDYLLMLMNGKGQEKLKRVFHITEGI